MSKKDVLTRTGISYGQFYRWKRKGLIPESWIRRKSTRTGHETFLPETKVIERIKRIKRLKEGNTLDEIAELLSPEATEKRYSPGEVIELGWVDSELLQYYADMAGTMKDYRFLDLVRMKFLEINRGELLNCELQLALDLLDRLNGDNFNRRLLVVRKSEGAEEAWAPYGCGKSFCIISDGEVAFDTSVSLITDVDLANLVQNIKVGMKGIQGHRRNERDEK